VKPTILRDLGFIKMYSFTNYLILYDICDNKRSNKILNILRGYCFHEQNSVFEGKLKKSQLIALKEKLNGAINKKEDSIIIYPLSKWNVFNKIIIGKRKYPKSQIF